MLLRNDDYLASYRETKRLPLVQGFEHKAHSPVRQLLYFDQVPLESGICRRIFLFQQSLYMFLSKHLVSLSGEMQFL